MIKGKRAIQLALLGALGAGLVLNCGKDDDDPVAAATYDLKVVDGAVEQFEAAEGATAAPAYGLAVTAAEIAADAAADSDVSYAIGAATDKIALTEWHTVAITQAPSNCASDSAITAAWADGEWSFTVKKDKVQGRSEACELTVTANMGEAVDSGWVGTVFSTGIDIVEAEADREGILTSKCASCHGNTGSGDFNMKVSDTFSLANVVAEKEDDVAGAKSYLYADSAALKASAIDAACTAGDVADVKRIAPGDPMNSLVLTLTNTTVTDVDGTNTVVANSLLNGDEIRYCDDSEVKAIWMPKGRKNTESGKYVWPKWVHTKIARWVLQGAKTE